LGRLNSTVINGSLNVSGKTHLSSDVNVNGALYSKNGLMAGEGVVGNVKLYIENNNEINFGGSNNASTIRFGYRAKDSKPIPIEFTFGGATGTANIVAGKITGNSNVESKGNLVSLKSGRTSSFGAENTSYCHFVTDATVGFHTNKPLYVTGDILAGPSYNKRAWLAGDMITNAVWNDYAELFKKHDPSVNYEAHHIIEVEPKSKTYKYSSTPNSKLAVGIVSNSYGFLLGGEEQSTEKNLKTYIPVGLAGRVELWVIGPIEAGDLITSSHIEGVGMKSELDNPKGTIIAKALDTDLNEDIKKINVLIMNC
jgi:hypothetical protein